MVFVGEYIVKCILASHHLSQIYLYCDQETKSIGAIPYTLTFEQTATSRRKECGNKQLPALIYSYI